MLNNNCGGFFTVKTTHFQSFQNQSILVPPLCHLDSVIGENYYNGHLKAMQWMPISGIGVILLSILVYRIRSLKQKWSFNCSESTEHHKQVRNQGLIFLKKMRTSIRSHSALHCLLPTMSSTGNLSTFAIAVYLLCSWVQAPRGDQRYPYQFCILDDPPQNAQHLDPHGEFNPFGSWFSSTGSILGNFGVPVGDKVNSSSTKTRYK
uniref:CUB domain-containing protein n=1 Tax=Angiostrongylus cantonensis TaxID=6313 RepID=A0A0K0CTX4_ANGCA